MPEQRKTVSEDVSVQRYDDCGIQIHRAVTFKTMGSASGIGIIEFDDGCLVDVAQSTDKYTLVEATRPELTQIGDRLMYS
jgi:hypothetical protein